MRPIRNNPVRIRIALAWSSALQASDRVLERIAKVWSGARARSMAFEQAGICSVCRDRHLGPDGYCDRCDLF